MKYEEWKISASKFEKVYSVQWRGNGLEKMSIVLLKPQPYLACKVEVLDWQTAIKIDP